MSRGLVPTPPLRLADLNGRPVAARGAFVLYWMTAARRTAWNFALDRALDLARQFDRPPLVVETLACGDPFASVRRHTFVLEGMRDQAAAFARAGITYHPYVETSPRAADGLIDALAERSCAVVTDSFPDRGHAESADRAARNAGVRFEAVDSNGLLPLAATERAFPTAFTFRLFLQRTLRPHLTQVPRARPLARRGWAAAAIPGPVLRRWPAATEAMLAATPAALAKLPIDHSVGPGALRGGEREGARRLAWFVGHRLDAYPERRSKPGVDGTARLSAHLHFGHVSVHQIVAAVARRERWTPARITRRKLGGRREGWWGLSPPAEAFIDQLVTWRELAFNGAARLPDHDGYPSLPGWARKTLDAHRFDPRPHVYPVEALVEARTHDPMWNAAMSQLVRDGWFHNVLRMLWGKKILEWAESPEAAFAALQHLMNRYALDGCDPTSTAGAAWVLGRYDRAWGPERPIVGTVRYLSSANQARKAGWKPGLQAATTGVAVAPTVST